MKTSDLFKINRSSKRLNESIQKIFGKKLNYESFTVPQLEDARNKLRTQISQVRQEGGFNETIENEPLMQAQFIHDAIVAELMNREGQDVEEPVDEGVMSQLAAELGEVAADEDFDKLYDLMGDSGPVGEYLQDLVNDITGETGLHPDDDHDRILSIVMDRLQDEFGEEEDDEDYYSLPMPDGDREESIEMEVAPPTAKGERMVKHIKKGYADDGKLTDKERSIAYATAWKQHNKEKNEEVGTSTLPAGASKVITGKEGYVRKQLEQYKAMGYKVEKSHRHPNGDVTVKLTAESKNTGEDMTKLQEGEIQQASAIVTAKTMVDRVGRWIEELSGMENDTLLQLGDSIRDEMGQEQAKQFISTVAPAIQSALENLKAARETLSGGVRTLTGEEQPAEMLGGEPGAEMGAEMGADMGAEMGPAEPDTMNAGDEFAAAEPAAGGGEAAGREQRESIQRSNRLMKMLAG
jgi:hypothetical protein